MRVYMYVCYVLTMYKLNFTNVGCMYVCVYVVKDRKAGKAGSSSSGSKKGGSESKEKKKSKKTNDVIELNEANFNALVLESSDHW